MAPRKKLGDALIDAGLIDRFQLESALGHQRQYGGRIGRILIDHGLVDERRLTRALSEQLGIPQVDLDNAEVHEVVLGEISRDLAKKFFIFPVGIRREAKGDLLYLAMADPSNVEAIDAVQFGSGKRVSPMIAGEQEVERAIRRYYFGENLRSTTPPPMASVQFSGSDVDLAPSSEDIPVVTGTALIEQTPNALFGAPGGFLGAPDDGKPPPGVTDPFGTDVPTSSPGQDMAAPAPTPAATQPPASPPPAAAPPAAPQPAASVAPSPNYGRPQIPGNATTDPFGGSIPPSSPGVFPPPQSPPSAASGFGSVPNSSPGTPPGGSRFPPPRGPSTAFGSSPNPAAPGPTMVGPETDETRPYQVYPSPPAPSAPSPPTPAAASVSTPDTRSLADPSADGSRTANPFASPPPTGPGGSVVVPAPARAPAIEQIEMPAPPPNSEGPTWADAIGDATAVGGPSSIAPPADASIQALDPFSDNLVFNLADEGAEGASARDANDAIEINSPPKTPGSEQVPCETCGNLIVAVARFCPQCGSQRLPVPGGIAPQGPKTGETLDLTDAVELPGAVPLSMDSKLPPTPGPAVLSDPIIDDTPLAGTAERNAGLSRGGASEMPSTSPGAALAVEDPPAPPLAAPTAEAALVDESMPDLNLAPPENSAAAEIQASFATPALEELGEGSASVNVPTFDPPPSSPEHVLAPPDGVLDESAEPVPAPPVSSAPAATSSAPVKPALPPKAAQTGVPLEDLSDISEELIPPSVTLQETASIPTPPEERSSTFPQLSAPSFANARDMIPDEELGPPPTHGFSPDSLDSLERMEASVVAAPVPAASIPAPPAPSPRAPVRRTPSLPPAVVPAPPALQAPAGIPPPPPPPGAESSSSGPTGTPAALPAAAKKSVVLSTYPPPSDARLSDELESQDGASIQLFTVSTSLASDVDDIRVWAGATGAPLTIPHLFPTLAGAADPDELFSLKGDASVPWHDVDPALINAVASEAAAVDDIAVWASDATVASSAASQTAVPPPPPPPPPGLSDTWRDAAEKPLYSKALETAVEVPSRRTMFETPAQMPTPAPLPQVVPKVAYAPLDEKTPAPFVAAPWATLSSEGPVAEAAAKAQTNVPAAPLEVATPIELIDDADVISMPTAPAASSAPKAPIAPESSSLVPEPPAIDSSVGGNTAGSEDISVKNAEFVPLPGLDDTAAPEEIVALPGGDDVGSPDVVALPGGDDVPAQPEDAVALPGANEVAAELDDAVALPGADDGANALAIAGVPAPTEEVMPSPFAPSPMQMPAVEGLPPPFETPEFAAPAPPSELSESELEEAAASDSNPYKGPSPTMITKMDPAALRKLAERLVQKGALTDADYRAATESEKDSDS